MGRRRILYSCPRTPNGGYPARPRHDRIRVERTYEAAGAQKLGQGIHHPLRGAWYPQSHEGEVSHVSRIAYIIAAVIALALLAAYVILTVTNHDGTGLLGALLGWLSGISVPSVAQKIQSGP